MIDMSKLSRKRGRAGQAPAAASLPVNFDDSAEDFEEAPPSAKSLRQETQVKEEDAAAPRDENALPPCPLCGKTFKKGQAAQRGNHLRGCGSKRGMTTETLLQVLRLEERQAREREEMGLPGIVVPGEKGPQQQQQTTGKKRRRKGNATTKAFEVRF